MKEKFDEDITLHRGVMEMVTVANEYCLFIEKTHGMEASEICGFFQKIAPLLYLKGSLLPNIVESDQVLAGRFVTEEQWEEVFNVLRQKFGKDDSFLIIDDSQEIMKASIAENFSDIYQDLKDFTLFFNENTFTSRKGALLQLQQLFPQRWGLSLLNGLSAVHNLLALQIKNEDEIDWEL